MGDDADYSAGIILTSFDMVLPIKQFRMTDKYIVSSNNQRILVYNYLKCPLENDEKFYIRMHEAKDNVDFLRYLEMKCHLSTPTSCESCECGRF